MNDKLSVVDTKLDVITGELQVAHKGIEALGKGQARMDDKLDWIMKCVAVAMAEYVCRVLFSNTALLSVFHM